MKTQTKSVMKNTIPMMGMLLAAVMGYSPIAHAEWHFGIGTGLSRTSIDGQQGINSLLGPIKYDVSLDPEEFSDITKSAFGFGGYATDGKWLYQYSLANIELEDESNTPVGASNVKLVTNFKMQGLEVTAGYPVYKSTAVVTFVDFGIRYTKHEFDNTNTITGPIINTTVTNSASHDWTDAILGVTVNVPIAPQWVWGSRLNAGFGGSDGTYFVSTGVTWRFHKNWTTGLNGKFVKVKYENGSPGDSDWYFYDADEKSVGINILYNW